MKAMSPKSNKDTYGIWKEKEPKSTFSPRNLKDLRRWLRSIGAVPTDAETERRMRAIGEWGRPKE